MPTLLRVESYFWLVPEVSVAAHRGYTARELARIQSIVLEHREILTERWLDACEGHG